MVGVDFLYGNRGGMVGYRDQLMGVLDRQQIVDTLNECFKYLISLIQFNISA